ncbi:MAG TPA: AarF/UbiB family protein [Actinopolymorphaceae bacterium]
MRPEAPFDNPLVIAVLALAFLLTLWLMIFGFSVAAGRLLGITIGRLRALAAGLFGYVTSAVVVRMIVPPRPEESPAIVGLIPVVLGVALVGSMAFLIVGEILLPSDRRRGLGSALRAVRLRLGRTRRYLQILRIAVRHGLGPYLRGGRGADSEQAYAGIARSLREAIEDGGVTFVKVGQLLSTRPDMLPPAFLEELGRLQDQVTPAPWPEVRDVLTAELGAPPEEIFADFAQEPLAAASVAQVHRARLTSGEEVVVKVQRPGIARVVERDLDIVRRLARTLETRTQWGRSLGAVALAEGFAVALREELDFGIEARNLAVVRAAAERRGDDDIRLPEVYDALSSRRVLVLGRLNGVPLGSTPRIDDADAVRLARSLLAFVLRQVMLDGTFHADPHPGNVLVLDDGRLGMLDFGSVGRVDAALRTAMQDLLLAIDRADPAGVRDALLDLVDRPEAIDERRLERTLGRFMARHLTSGARPDLSMFTDLFAVVADFDLAVHAEVAAVFRALATLEGTLGLLAPGFDIVEESRRFAQEQLSLSVAAGASARDVMRTELIGLLPLARRLPRRIDRITSALEQGRLAVNVRIVADERDRRYLNGLLHQIVLAFLGAAAGLMGVLLLGTPGGPRLTRTIELYDVFGYNLFVVSGLLVLRVLFLSFRSLR